uniref:Capsid n=1 Tax=viral metagenome TaxID=1070528 RepID=A0A2V0RL40_9ZZZZ
MLGLLSICTDLLFKQVSGIRRYKGGKIMFKRQTTIVDSNTLDKLAKVKSRRKCDLASYGTFYGRNHDVRIGTAINSPSGLNIEVVNAEGRLTESIIEKFALTQMCGDNQRLTNKNQLSNALKRMDTYENSTTLLLILLLEYYTKINIEKNDTKTRKFNSIKHSEFITNFTKTVIDTVLNTATSDLENHPDIINIKEHLFNYFLLLEDVGGSFIVDDDYHNTIVNSIIDNIKNKGFDEKIIINYDYWYVDKYNDGHNEIDQSRYEKAGFKNRKFIVNKRDHIYVANTVRCFDEFIKVTDSNDLERFNNQENKIRCDSFSPKEFLILTTLIQGRKRSTPFLSDQTVQLSNIDDCYFYGNKDASIEMNNYAAQNPNLNISSKEICNVIQKYVSLHRVYDDMYAAHKIALTYICQPDCDTMESHYWFNMEFDTILPKFRVFRGVHSYFTTGQPVRLNRLAMEFWDTFKSHWDTLFNASIVENSLWMQAEFLSNINSTNDEYLQYTINDPIYIKRDRTTHISTCISSITGLAEITNMFDHTGTLIKCRGQNIFEGVLLKVDKVESEDKVKLMNNLIHVQSNLFIIEIETVVPVSPSGDIFIIGLNGSLLDNTPLRSNFTIKKNEKHRVRKRFVMYYSYLQLWAWALISRYTGYDVRYTLGSDQTRNNPLVCYAANNVQVVKPPIHDVLSERYYPYVMEDVCERAIILGENPFYSMQYGEEREMTWYTGEIRLFESTEWNSFESMDLRTVNQMTDVVYTDFQMDVKYIAKVKAVFKNIQEDFQRELFYLGDSIHRQEEQLPENEQQEILTLEEEPILESPVNQDE